MTKITVAKTAGYCYGVRRAIQTARDCARKQRPVYTVGQLIHNKFVVEQLRQEGIFACDSAEQVPDGAPAVIRAHGVTQREEALLRQKGCLIVDATCPHVARIHRIVEQESRAGRHILLIGDASHPETVGAASRCACCTILETPAQAQKWAEDNADTPVSAAVQTTFNHEIFVNCAKILKNACKSV